MTRKQALMRVYEILSTYGETEEITEIKEKLQEVIDELPFTSWSESTIFDTIDQWIIENGKIPSTKDLTKKGLPPVPVIKNRFKMKARAFLDEYYPKPELQCASMRYGDRSMEEWIADFVAQYESIHPRSAGEYNQRRDAGSPTWATVASICGLQRWNDLLDYCKLDKPKKIVQIGRKRQKVGFTIHREIDLEKALSKLSK